MFEKQFDDAPEYEEIPVHLLRISEANLPQAAIESKFDPAAQAFTVGQQVVLADVDGEPQRSVVGTGVPHRNLCLKECIAWRNLTRESLLGL